jgi:hypothetical protein
LASYVGQSWYSLYQPTELKVEINFVDSIGQCTLFMLMVTYLDHPGLQAKWDFVGYLMDLDLL